LSFFDEADEPTRRAPRPRRASPTGGGGRQRPPMDHQTLLVRRLVAAGAVVLVIVLLVVLIKGCVDSQRTQSLKDYNRSVSGLAQESVSGVSKPFFQALSGAAGQQVAQVQETLNQYRQVADEQLAQAGRLSVPDEMAQAQRDLQLVLSLRRDGVAKIAALIQPALGKTAAASAAVNQIAGQMRAFDASDVVYSQRVAPLILQALKNDGISAGYDGSSGEQVQAESPFLPSLSWINPDFVAGAIGASVSGAANAGKPTPGLHGHSLDSVAVGGTTLDTSQPNRIPASPPPTFTVNFTNGGEHDETNVKVDVTVTGSGPAITASKVVPTTTAGQSTSVDVQLPRAPSTAGPSTIKVTVEKVPGESSTDNNTQTYSALFT
jgi:hypothetical protein